MHNPRDGELRLPTLEDEVKALWDRAEVPERFARSADGAERWVTYEGPPTVNGSPALHHMWTSVYKDVYGRFHTMRGRQVERRAGWDCQGLPVEIAVEKRLGLESKPDIERYGVESFIEECRRLVTTSIGEFETMFDRIAYWVDLERPYRTMDDEFIESVWWHLQRLWERGLVFEGHKVMPYCTRCGTALSSHELGQPGVYQERRDDAVFVALAAIERDLHLVVWTTTPWTLIANVAVAVDPQRHYGVYERDGRRLVVALDRGAELFGDLQPTETVLGSDLIGLTYQRPYATEQADETVPGRVVGWEEVAGDVGSGMVHMAPAFGEDDFAVCREAGLRLMINPIDDRGVFIDGPYRSEHALDAVQPVIADLDERGLLVDRHVYAHPYPHCWRCRTPLLYWAKPSWFIGTSSLSDRFIEENERIAWHPENIKHGRFGQWLEANVDWAVARDRFWGTPLPVWRCPDGHDTCVGSRAELSKLAGQELEELSLHRPHVDAVTFPCPECEQTAERLASVCDVWLDSGCMPAAQWAYPHRDEAAFGSQFPADFICEAIDQTRGWFYSLLAVNTMVFGQTPYRNVVCLGHLVDAEGRKMSKSLGNVIDPFEVIERFGSDGVRWYLYTSGAPWGPRRISLEAIEQRARRDLATLWNVASFYLTYADVEGFVPTSASADARPAVTHVLDRWLLSRLDRLTADVTDLLEGYEAHRAAARIADFVDDLSNWYVRRGRRRYYGRDDTAAFEVLRHALVTASRLLAPFCPFLAEGLYQALDGPATGAESVHLAGWPALDDAGDEALEEQMTAARTVASLARSARTDAQVPVRQPLRRALAFGIDPLPDDVRALVEEEINVGALEVGRPEEVPVTRELRPNWRRLGPRFKGIAQQVGSALAEASDDTVRRLGAGEAVTLEVDGSEVEIAPDDVEVVERVEAGWAAAEERGVTLVLDTVLDDDLVDAFHRRSLVRLVQMGRREAGLHVADRIVLWIPRALWEGREEIAEEVLAADVRILEDDEPAAGAWRGEGYAFVRV